MKNDQAGETIVRVRRQYNDWRDAAYRLRDISGFHYSDVSGGINARANREYLCAYVQCDQMIQGELPFSVRGRAGLARRMALFPALSGEIDGQIAKLAGALLTDAD